jgi:hypothetical protein
MDCKAAAGRKTGPPETTVHNCQLFDTNGRACPRSARLIR